jgi:dTDP-4-amino-4,6-dideoxygalactose transaminase
MIYTANPSAQFLAHQSEIEEAVLNVMRGNSYILGEEVSALENEFAAYIGTTEAIGVANGTDALELSLRALNISPGDEVITVSHTAVATVASIESAGAVPVLVDIEANFFTMDASKLAGVFSNKTKAVIVVHLYGQSADMNAIQVFCKKNKLALIEDVSQAHGATWNGKRLGSIGDIACFSCYPTKNLGALGDAGLVTTNNSELAERVRALREYGWVKGRYISEFPGRNSRLDELQAAVLRVKLKYLDDSNHKRTELARKYNEAFKDQSCIQTPKVRVGADHVFHLYVVNINNRNIIIERLQQKGIYVGIHYPLPIHLQPGYIGRVKTSLMKNTETISKQILSLPMFPEFKVSDQTSVIEAIKEALN